MKKITLAVLSLVLGIQPLFSQLKKGDMSVGFSSSFLSEKNSFYQDSRSNRAMSVSPSVGYMFSDKFMLGTGLSYRHFKGAFSSSEEYSGKSFSITPFVRYYFLGNNKLNPFAFIGSSFFYYKNDYQSINGTINKDFIVSAAGGFGMDYFLAPNIALQATIGTSLFQDAFSATYDDIFFANIGIQTFINDREKTSGDLMGNYLCKGNFVISANGRFTFDDNPQYYRDKLNNFKANQGYHDLSLSSQVKYFTSNVSSLLFGGNISSYGTGTNSSNSVGLKFGAERYWSLGKRLYFAPLVTLDIGVIQSKGYSVQPSFTTSPTGGSLITFDTVQLKNTVIPVNGEISLTLKYFTKGSSIFSFGPELSTIRYYQITDGNNNITNRWNLFADYEYFFNKNLSVILRANYYKSNITQGLNGLFSNTLRENSRMLNFTLSLNYFIFNNKCGIDPG